MECIGVIGGIAADVEGRPFRILIPADSNPGIVKVSHGGVGRNIAENLVHMGENNVVFCSVVGDDELGRAALDSLAQSGIDPSGIAVLQDGRTSMYLSILDNDGEMVLAVSDMDIFKQFTPHLIEAQRALLADASVVALDANLPEETLAHCAQVFSDKKIFADPVSVHKARRLCSILPACYAVKPNRIEAEQLVGFPIRNERQLTDAGKALLDMGVCYVFISLGQDGLFFMDQNEKGLLSVEMPYALESVTGAGDAASAAIVDGLARNLPIEKIAAQAMRASKLTLQTQERVHPDIGTIRLV